MSINFAKLGLADPRGTPQQLAVGVGGGLSVLIHGVRLYLEQNADHVAVRIDLKNAYNTGSRRKLCRSPPSPAVGAARRSYLPLDLDWSRSRRGPVGA